MEKRKKTPKWFLWFIKTKSNWKLVIPLLTGFILGKTTEIAFEWISSPSDFGVYSGITILLIELFLVVKFIMAVILTIRNEDFVNVDSF